MAAHPLTRGEIAELAGRLHGLLEMIAVDELIASTGMTYRSLARWPLLMPR
jgi:hypothetical protein